MAKAKASFAPTERLKLVQIFPHGAIVVKGDLNTERKQDITIFNPTPMEIAFKMKVTSAEIKINPAFGYVKPLGKVVTQMVVKPQKMPLTKNDRVTILLCVAPKPKPETAKQFWKANPSPKDARKEIRAVRFVISQGGTETTVTTTVTEDTVDASTSED